MATIVERLKDQPKRLVVLAACAFARSVEHLLEDERSIAAIETAERFADGQGTVEEVEEAAWAARRAAHTVERFMEDKPSSEAKAEEAAETAAWAAARAAEGAAGTAAWAAESAEWASAPAPIRATHQSMLDCLLAPRIQHAFPAHVKGLATTIYEKRDWTLMPILADALEEIGQAEMASIAASPFMRRAAMSLMRYWLAVDASRLVRPGRAGQKSVGYP